VNVARLLVALLLVLPAKPQEPVPATEISFERVTRASKEFLRDSAELPMRLTVDFSATDLTGRVRKHKTGKFDYDFHGFNPRSNNGNLNLHGPKHSLKEAGTTAAIAMLPSVLVASGVEQRIKMKIIDSPQPDTFAADLVDEEKSGPEEKCQTFGWMREAYLFKHICLGHIQVQLQKDDLSIKSFASDIDGLPLQAKVDHLGQANITGYHVDIDFQKVMLPGDPKPFVVPWHVTVSVVTDKGKLVMAAEFALKK
jgi:hypothetical protein